MGNYVLGQVAAILTFLKYFSAKPNEPGGIRTIHSETVLK